MNAVVSEREFTAQVIAMARLFGWRSAHFRPARTARGWVTPVEGDGIGFPDVILTRGPRLVAIELKSAKGRLGSGQQEWLDAFAAAGAETLVCRPCDFDMLVELLRREDAVR